MVVFYKISAGFDKLTTSFSGKFLDSLPGIQILVLIAIQIVVRQSLSVQHISCIQFLEICLHNNTSGNWSGADVHNESVPPTRFLRTAAGGVRSNDNAGSVRVPTERRRSVPRYAGRRAAGDRTTDSCEGGARQGRNTTTRYLPVRLVCELLH